jgi:hypothetical protein
MSTFELLRPPEPFGDLALFLGAMLNAEDGQDLLDLELAPETFFRFVLENSYRSWLITANGTVMGFLALTGDERERLHATYNDFGAEAHDLRGLIRLFRQVAVDIGRPIYASSATSGWASRFARACGSAPYHD